MHQTHIPAITSSPGISSHGGERTRRTRADANGVLAGSRNRHLYIEGTGANGGIFTDVGLGYRGWHTGCVTDKSNQAIRVRTSIIVKINAVTIAGGRIITQDNSIQLPTITRAHAHGDQHGPRRGSHRIVE